ncbi:helix-turn-helix domain-containing protein, partial [Legionella pneumophila]|nr:helix-turn-helix domain-containing protein [Legionella pneumophila]
MTRLIASCLNSFENDLRIFSSQLSVYYPLTGCVHPLDHVIITKVSEGKITINNAAKLLNCSRRTIERYLNRYQKFGIKFAI